MEKKMVLMGKSGSGKTSMTSMIFDNYYAKDTKVLTPTVGVKYCNVNLFENLKFNILDCGGKTKFLVNYFKNQIKEIFSNVNILIYVSDVTTLNSKINIACFHKCIDSVIKYSPNVKVYCLLHKMDLIKKDSDKENILSYQNKIINVSKPFKITFFETTIYNKTLYEAWSSIVKPSIPNIEMFDTNLRMFFDKTECEEVALFEISTVLLLFTCGRSTHSNTNIFQKVFNILKTYKNNNKSSVITFKAIEMNYGTYRLFIEKFTKHTYIMVVVQDSKITSNIILSNIKNSRQIFKNLESQMANSEPISSVDS